MTTADPLLPAPPEDDFEVSALDDLSHLPPDVRAAIEGAEARSANGTAETVPHSEVERFLAEQRRRHGG